MKGIARRKASGREVEIWFQDEARGGQVGRTGRVWFERGQRPRGPRDMRRKAAWIFGAVCPARDTGDALVLLVATTEAMQAFLDELTQAVPADRHAVLLIDRAGWHTARRLRWPETVTPLHLPPCSPELNGIERVWLHLKERFLSHRVFKDMTTIIDASCDAWNNLLAETGRICSLANMPWLKQVKSS